MKKNSKNRKDRLKDINFSPFAITATLIFFPEPLGKFITPLIF